MCNKIKAFFGIGSIYGVGRSWYYMNQVTDCTYTDSGDKNHVPTKVTKLWMTWISVSLSSVLWPIFILKDLDELEKRKMAIQYKYPPFPFHLFKWKIPENSGLKK